ncbi:MAG: SEC61-beta family protein [Candidatus Nanoarchaeia archaeon]
MAKATAQTNQSTGGIMRYFSDYKSKLSLKPGYVIFASIIIILTVIILHAITP